MLSDRLSVVTHLPPAAAPFAQAAPAVAPVRVDEVVRQVDLLGEANLELVAGMLGRPVEQVRFVWRRAIDEGFLTPAGARHTTTPLAWVLLAA